MMHGPEKSDLAIVAGKPTNKAERSAAELVERRAGPRGMRANQARAGLSAGSAWHRVLARIRQLTAVATRGGRSYGAGGGGCGTFIVHTNRWRLPRGPNQ
jgi:hypothetical protein